MPATAEATSSAAKEVPASSADDDGVRGGADVVEPARRLAAEGHIVSQYNASLFHLAGKLLDQFPASKKIYLKDGTFWQAGERWVQADLAETFARLQKNGPREFYEGETAKRIADAMAKHGGNITLNDLKIWKSA